MTPEVGTGTNKITMVAARNWASEVRASVKTRADPITQNFLRDFRGKAEAIEKAGPSGKAAEGGEAQDFRLIETKEFAPMASLAAGQAGYKPHAFMIPPSGRKLAGDETAEDLVKEVRDKLTTAKGKDKFGSAVSYFLDKVEGRIVNKGADEGKALQHEYAAKAENFFKEYTVIMKDAVDALAVSKDKQDLADVGGEVSDRLDRLVDQIFKAAP